jgi:hypothetical protein
MADSTDFPRPFETPSTADAPLSAPGLAPAPPSIEERMEHRQLYQPLSVLAVVGLVIAIGYALVVAVGSIIALSKGSPWIMGGWTALFPVFAIVVSVVAWLQVQRSEGTLGGRRLALTGIGVALAFGLGYWAYFLATYLAIRQKADTVAREWMAHLAKGEDEAAFWWALDPLKRPSRLPTDPSNAPAFVKDIETRFNTPEGNAGEGMFSQFERGDLIHVLREAGPDVQIESLGMSEWGYSPEGYHVTLEYRATSREASYDITITLHGNEAQHQEYVGRQWYIAFDKAFVRGEPRFTEYGKKMAEARMLSQVFIENWQARLGRGEIDLAFLDTCDPKVRERLHRPFLARLACGDAMLLGMTPCNPGLTQFYAFSTVNMEANSVLKDSLPGYKKFTEGSLIHADPKRFWVPDESRREEILNDVKALFADPGPDLVRAMRLSRSMMPLTREENGRLQVLHHCSLMLESKKMFVEGILYVESDSDAVPDGAPIARRVARIELLRAKSAAQMPMQGRPGMQGGPGGSGMRPGGRAGPGMPGGPPPLPPVP